MRMYYIFDEKTGKWTPSRTEKLRDVECDSEKLVLQLVTIEPNAEKLTVDFRATYAKVEKIVDEMKMRQIYYESVFDMKKHAVIENPLERSQFSLLESSECQIPLEVLEILKNVLELLSDIENYVRNPLRRIAGDENKIENTKINYLDTSSLGWRDSGMDYEFILPKNTDEVYFYSDWLSMFRKEDGKDYIAEVLKNV